MIALPISDLLSGVVHVAGEHVIPIGHQRAMVDVRGAQAANAVPPLHLPQAVETDEHHLPVRRPRGVAELTISGGARCREEEALIRQLVDEYWEARHAL